MVSVFSPSLMIPVWTRKCVPVLLILSTLVTGCGVRSLDGESEATISPTQEIGSKDSSLTPPSDNGKITGPEQVVINKPLDYCFAVPRDFTQIYNDSQVEVVGPYSGAGPEPGLVWIDVTDARGRTAEEIAHDEVNAFGGSPPRTMVMLGGEEGIVLDGMPGQDPIRKVYIVHNGSLYTLNFSPYESDNATAKAQMKTLFDSVSSSWVWMSSGAACPEIQ